jgi:hypothetical protein
MEVLAKYGTKEQQVTWLLPLLRGDIRSCFAMTEKQVASSDATNIQASIRVDGARLVLDGRKWWGAAAWTACATCIPRAACGVSHIRGGACLPSYRCSGELVHAAHHAGLAALQYTSATAMAGQLAGHESGGLVLT